MLRRKEPRKQEVPAPADAAPACCSAGAASVDSSGVEGGVAGSAFATEFGRRGGVGRVGLGGRRRRLAHCHLLLGLPVRRALGLPRHDHGDTLLGLGLGRRARLAQGELVLACRQRFRRHYEECALCVGRGARDHDAVRQNLDVRSRGRLASDQRLAGRLDPHDVETRSILPSTTFGRRPTGIRRRRFGLP